MNVTALILAAGSGTRLEGRPKAFLRWRGRTLLEHAVATVTPFASEIIVGVRRGDVKRSRALVPKSVRIVVGGQTRQETMSRLLRQATQPVVLLHEVARPFATAEMFARLLKEIKQHDAVALYVNIPARDSLALLEGQELKMMLPRRNVVALQIPHAYRREVLVKADRRATQGGWKEEGTAAMVQRAGYRIRLVPGAPDNIKVTYPEDLKLIKAAPCR